MTEALMKKLEQRHSARVALSTYRSLWETLRASDYETIKVNHRESNILPKLHPRRSDSVRCLIPQKVLKGLKTGTERKLREAIRARQETTVPRRSGLGERGLGYAVRAIKEPNLIK